MIGEKQALQWLTQFHLLTSLIGLILVNKFVFSEELEAHI